MSYLTHNAEKIRHAYKSNHNLNCENQVIVLMIIDGKKWHYQNYNENSDTGYFLKVDVEYLKRLQNFDNDLPFLPERMKIKKCNKLVCNLFEKNKYVVHIGILKQALNHGLPLKRLLRVIQFN